jgi:uncharacterized protein YjbI with pentapeptide repeats
MCSLLSGKGDKETKKLAMVPVIAAQRAGPAEDLIAGLRTQCLGCDLPCVSFQKADLEGVDLTGADLTDASFHRAH